jgi:hypothetical protein
MFVPSKIGNSGVPPSSQKSRLRDPDSPAVDERAVASVTPVANFVADQGIAAPGVTIDTELPLFPVEIRNPAGTRIRRLNACRAGEGRRPDPAGSIRQI